MKKILVADDEELIRRLVSDFLVQEGYEPLLAVDGDEALSLFESNPDTALMILDIMMPGTDGWEVCRKVRESSQLPIIMLSARSTEFDQLTAFDYGYFMADLFSDLQYMGGEENRTTLFAMLFHELL